MSDHSHDRSTPDRSNESPLTDLQQEIQALRDKRRQLIIQHFAVPILGIIFLIGLREAEVAPADAWWLAAIAFGLITWAAGRAIADTVATLDEECPTCSEPFFGGLARAHLALPLPPKACVHCGLRLDAGAPAHRESGSTPG